MRPGAARRPPRRWLDALTSLWSPAVAFLLGLVLYLWVIELSPGSARWATPAIRGFGLAMLLGVPLLALGRARVPGFLQARSLRIEARELAREVRGSALRRRDLPDAAREELRALADRLAATAEEGTPEAVRAGTQALSQRATQLGLRASGAALVRLVLTAVAVALLVRGALLEPYRIPTGSMLPTLQVGDQVLVNRFLYGVQVPFTQWVPFPFVRRPRRGDVVVFNEPVTNSEAFIKRVVGVPGDRLELIEGVLYLNGQPQPQRVVDAEHRIHERRGEGWRATPAVALEEDLDGRSHPMLRRRAPTPGRREGPWVVPEGHVFVLGDDRDASADSRYGFGRTRGPTFVPYGNIKGKAMVIWLSLSYDGILSNLFGGTGLRADRLLTPVR